MTRDAQIVFRGARFHVLEHKGIDDGSSEPLLRHTVQHPGAVAIVPLLEGDRVCLIRNHRIAVGKSLIELPAGTLEPLEAAQQTAERELREETGYRATRWREMPSFFMSPGILNERMYLFVADGLVAGPPAREAGEEIDNYIVSWSEAVAMAQSGEIEDAKSLVGILLWERLRNTL